MTSNDLLAKSGTADHIPIVINANWRPTMHDDFESAAWAANHAKLSAQFHKVIEAIGIALDRLHAHQFDAPWRATRRADVTGKC